MFVRYIGVILTLIGAVLLMLQAFAHIMPQNNLILIIGLALVVIGFILFIFLDKKMENKVDHDYEDESVRINPIQQTPRD